MSGGFQISDGLCNGADSGVDLANSRGTAVTTGASNAYGSYTTIASSTSADAVLMVVDIWTNGAVNTGNAQSVTIAVGAAANEKDIVSDLFILQSASNYRQQTYMAPINIPAGSRISAKGAGGGASETVYVSIRLFDGSFADDGFSGVDSLGFSAGAGVSVTGTAGAKSSFAQVTASTTRDYLGFLFAPATTSYTATAPTGREYWDIAIGASGSEQVIIPNVALDRAGQIWHPGPYMVHVPAGSRIAIRGENSAGANSALVLYGIF